MKWLLLPLFSWLVVPVWAQSPDVREVLQKTVDYYLSNNAAQYDIEFKKKYLSREDTTTLLGNTYLIRMPEDTLFGSMIWITTDTNYATVYDLNHFYKISYKAATITRYPGNEEFKWVMQGNIASGLKEINFIYAEKLLNIIDTTNEVSIELIDSIYHISVRYPDSETVSGIVSHFYIDANTFIIIKKSQSLWFQGNEQFSEFQLSNCHFGQDDGTQFKEKLSRLLEEYTVTDHVETEETERPPLLDAGTEAPLFDGYIYPDSVSFSLTDHRGKYVLIDFWYMSCYPCIMAIPHLTALDEKYREKGLVVIGANPVDTAEKDIKRFPKFLENNPISYPIVWTERNVPTDYKVRGYPTFYLLDREGKVIYSGVGFSEEHMQEMDGMIGELLDE
jgi:thiol-disulfide isomerase/thioredoxin